jgi:hypothetical protein
VEATAAGSGTSAGTEIARLEPLQAERKAEETGQADMRLAKLVQKKIEKNEKNACQADFLL